MWYRMWYDKKRGDEKTDCLVYRVRLLCKQLLDYVSKNINSAANQECFSHCNEEFQYHVFFTTLRFTQFRRRNGSIKGFRRTVVGRCKIRCYNVKQFF